MEFKKVLTNWYSDNKRNLPWRNTKNPYFIWLSEIILQQTQIKQGLPYYETFVNRYPTVFDLANATEESVLKTWQGLGNYSRARNLHASAKFIANDLNGVFPTNYKDIKALKGVGDYTASAIASICFNEPTAVVDGNVYRVLSRYFGIDTPINTTKGIKEFKLLATELIELENPGDYNQALMEFGATHCKPKNPYCFDCPFSNSCVAYNKGLINKLPVKLKKTKVVQKYINFLVILSRDQKTVVFERRTGKGIWQNLYQFPMVESGKSLKPSEFHLLNLTTIPIKHGSLEYSLYNETDIIHKLSHQHLYTKFWIIEVDQLLKSAIPISTIKSFPVPILIGKFLEEFKFPI
ncbi:MAG: A/G-specific adenine glycosylase [Psychroserpens sp.]|nr:A/G-specific adenine glycosylase [Psychroserpens sp.]